MVNAKIKSGVSPMDTVIEGPDWGGVKPADLYFKLSESLKKEGGNDNG